MDCKAKSLLISLTSDEYLGCMQKKSTTNAVLKVLEDTLAMKSVGKQAVIMKQIVASPPAEV